MLLLRFIAGLIPSAYAATLDQWGSDNSGVSAMWAQIRATLYTRQDPVQALIGATIMFIFPLIGAVAVILIIYAGIRMISSQGKDDVIAQSKTIILYALVGVILAILATTVVMFFADTFFPALFQ